MVTVAAWLVLAGPAQAQSELLFPGNGAAGTLLFEDGWPQRLDWDFNDLVVRYRYRFLQTGGSDYHVTTDLAVHAVGAAYCNGLGLRLPYPAGSVTAARLKRGTPGAVDGAPWTDLADAEIDASGGQVVLWLTDDVRADWCGDQTGFLNTDPDLPATACSPVTLDVALATPQAHVASEPYDLFLYRCDDRTHQVHQSGYSGLPDGAYAADTELYGTFDDESVEVGGPWYVQGGVPFVLNLGEGGDEGDGLANWPAEGADIADAFPRILSFPGDPAYADYYWNGVDDDFTWTAPKPPAPVGDFDRPTSCRPLHTARPLLPSGQYLIDPDGFGTGADPHWNPCDMTTADGGWTLVGRSVPSTTHPAWSQTSGYGSAAAGAYISPAWHSLTDYTALMDDVAYPSAGPRGGDISGCWTGQTLAARVAAGPSTCTTTPVPNLTQQPQVRFKATQTHNGCTLTANVAYFFYTWDAGVSGSWAALDHDGYKTNNTINCGTQCVKYSASCRPGDYASSGTSLWVR